jgi:hypothetical protein
MNKSALLELASRILDYFAWLKHTYHEEMDTATSGLWGYWKREPYWPRAAALRALTEKGE